MKTPAPKILLPEKLGFGLGEFGNNLFWQFFMYFQFYFYTDIFKIAPGADAAKTAGIMFMIVRSVDSFIDMLIGIIADRTETRWGKYRPWLLFGAVPFGLIGVAAFTTPDFSQATKVIYAYLTYSLLMVIYSTVSIPQNSLLGVMTDDPAERTILSKYKFLFAFAAGFTVKFCTPWLVGRLGAGNDALGYQRTVWIFAAIAIIGLSTTFLTIRERVFPPKEQKPNLGLDLRQLLSNGPWIAVVFIGLFTILSIAIRSGTLMHYFKYYVGNQTVAVPLFGMISLTYGELFSGFMFIGSITAILGTFTVPWMDKTLGRRGSYAFYVGSSAALIAAVYMVKPGQITALFLLEAGINMLQAPTCAVLWTMFADCADFGEWKHGRRATALIFSAGIMSNKWGWALGALIPGYLLTSFGYIADAVQSERTLSGMVLIVSLIPAGFAALAAILTLTYPLTTAKLKTIHEELKQRRGEDDRVGDDLSEIGRAAV